MEDVMKNLLFVFNPVAGKGIIANKIANIITFYSKRDYLVTVLPTAKQEVIFKVLITNGTTFDLIVCAGGDGTLNQVVTSYLKSQCKLPIGYIPAGSTNDFAKTLGFNGDFQNMIDNTCSDIVRKIDVGKFDDQYFIYVAAFGSLAEISYSTPQEIKNILGHFAYILKGIQKITDLKAYQLRMECNHQVIEGEFIIGLIMNSVSIGGFKNLFSEKFFLDDGLFEILLIRMPRNINQLQTIIIDLMNKNLASNMFVYMQSDSIKFESEPMGWSLDGEFGGIIENVEIRNFSKAIPIIGNNVGNLYYKEYTQ